MEEIISIYKLILLGWNACKTCNRSFPEPFKSGETSKCGSRLLFL